SGGDYKNYLGEGKTYTPNFHQTGVYYVVCKSRWNETVVTTNEIKITAFYNSILPNQDQIIEANEKGESITVKEIPETASREWKYKITGTDNWESFLMKQKRKSYTPSFSTAGKYSVACFSSINGKIAKSNEVEILVVDNEILPKQDQTMEVGSDGTELRVSETCKSHSQKWYYSTVSGGDKKYLCEGKTYTPNFSQAGVYYVVCKSQWNETVVTTNEKRITVFGNSISPTQDQIVEANKNGKVITVTEVPKATSREWKYKTSEKGEWKSFKYKMTNLSCMLSFDTGGTYYVACFSTINNKQYQSNQIVINVVSNRISPTSNQFIINGQKGEELTVTETKILNVDSRAWYYSSEPKKFNTYLSNRESYIPSFDEFGDYYIVCKSTWGSLTSVSNYVKVTVADVSIAPNSNQVIDKNTNGATIAVREYPKADSRQWKYKLKEAKQWKSFSKKEIKSKYIPNFSSEGTYLVACFSQINGSEIKSNEVEIQVNDGVGIDSYNKESACLVSPNPSNGGFVVECSETVKKIDIFNTNGALIYSKVYKNEKRVRLSIDIGGMFSVIVTTEKGIKYIRKVIIK
ncbi:MAG: T9SS type A sorting domain-containing protein, partial [Bacteroidales bacterium]|nr:T9SS type A sorting domain-containing protein [Bacteroidales bacterium]